MVLFELFIEFFKIGVFTYGGGLAMLPLLQDIAVDKGWLSISEFADLIAISQSTPGPIAINMATFIGYNNGGIFGALISSIAVILPAFLLILIIANFLKHFNEHPMVKAIIIGLKAAVIGLVFTAILQVAFYSLYISNNVTIMTFYKGIDYKAVGLFLVILYAVDKYKKHPIVYIGLAGIIGNILW
ncbi:MAG: chromate transporter [Eubacteriales bacterium]